jgi:hypothetical protein
MLSPFPWKDLATMSHCFCSLIGISLVCCVVGSAASAADPEFRPLFDGKSFDGWTQHGGKAQYTIEDGMVVGTAVADTPNSFMCTNKEYGDFELELEFKVHPDLNSGVQIRSQVFAEPKEITVPDDKGGEKTLKIAADRVHGYQVEIDPKERAWSGGIYDEGRRGWLNDLKNNDAARKAFKPNEWNSFRILCKGDHIQTWINGVPAADLHDDMTPKGLIALQVHGIGKEAPPEPRQIRWRNIRIRELN